MKTIIVNNSLKNTRVKKKVERELRWYDTEKKQLLFFTGGQLEFEHKYDDEFEKYRMLPKVVDLEVTDYENKGNIEDIKNWAKTNLNYSNAEVMAVSKDSVVFQVPDDEVEDFTEALDDNRFEYSVS